MAPPKAGRPASAKEPKSNPNHEPAVKKVNKKAKHSGLSSAASQVLGVVELLEQILSYSTPEALLHVKAVSKLWRATIMTSPTLNKILPPYLFDRVGKHRNSFRYQLANFGRGYRLGWDTVGVVLWPHYRGRFTALLQQHSLRHLQLSNPPTTKATVEYWCECNKYHEYVRGPGRRANQVTIKNSKGITFGEMLRDVENASRLTCRHPQKSSQGRLSSATITLELLKSV